METYTTYTRAHTDITDRKIITTESPLNVTEVWQQGRDCLMDSALNREISRRTTVEFKSISLLRIDEDGHKAYQIAQIERQGRKYNEYFPIASLPIYDINLQIVHLLRGYHDLNWCTQLGLSGSIKMPLLSIINNDEILISAETATLVFTSLKNWVAIQKEAWGKDAEQLIVSEVMLTVPLYFDRNGNNPAYIIAQFGFTKPSPSLFIDGEIFSLANELMQQSQHKLNSLFYQRNKNHQIFIPYMYFPR